MTACKPCPKCGGTAFVDAFRPPEWKLERECAGCGERISKPKKNEHTDPK